MAAFLQKEIEGLTPPDKENRIRLIISNTKDKKTFRFSTNH